MVLVLLMEGTNQFISWRHVVEYVDRTFASITTSNFTVQDLSNVIDEVMNNEIFEVTEAAYVNVTTLFDNFQSPNATSAEMKQDALGIILGLLRTIFNGYGFEPPESAVSSDDAIVLIDAYYSVFELVFGYFFISAGLVLILLAVLSWLSHSNGLYESRAHLGGIVCKVVIGVGLVFLSLMVMSENADKLGESPWTLPLLFFLLLIALILQHLPYTQFKRKAKSLPRTG
jgi:hypothetical protein